MGLSIDRFEFPGEPPRKEELVEHLVAQLGSVRAFDSYEVDGRRAAVFCMFEPVTRPYAIAFMLARGGTRIDGGGNPVPTALPAFVERPWRDHPWWFRLKTRFSSIK